MASSGVITVEPKGAFSTIRVVRQEGEGAELDGSVDHHYIKRSGGVADHSGVEAQPTTGGGAADHSGGVADHGGGVADHSGGVADHSGGVADHSSEEEASLEGEAEASSEEGGSTPAGPAASLRHPKGGSAADSGSLGEDASPPCPPSGGAGADDDRGARVLDDWQSAMDRANGTPVNGTPVNGLPSGYIYASNPETRLKRTIAQERAERRRQQLISSGEQLTLGVTPDLRAQLEQCSWYTDPYGRKEPPPDRRARPRRPRFQAQVVPPPPVERDIGWEGRKTAREKLAALVVGEDDEDGRI